MKKSLGQHFLFDKNIIKKIIRCSDVSPDDTVVEVGPGPGIMTSLLADLVKRVVAIEYDRRLVEKLTASLQGKRNVRVIQADALKFPYDSIGGSFKVVSNIPYYITTPLLFRLLEYRNRIPSMTLLMQKEVARRIGAQPRSKDYGVLSISSQLYTEPVIKFNVSRKAFSPPPDVDSAVVFFRVSEQPRYAVKDLALFHRIVKSAFSWRRKMLLNSLKSFTGIIRAMEEAEIDTQTRPERLGIEDFVRLANALKR